MKESPIYAVNEIIRISRASFKWCYKFFDENYPGSVFSSLEKEDGHDDFLLASVSEIIARKYNELAVEDREIYRIAIDFVNQIEKYGDNELKETLHHHMTISEAIDKYASSDSSIEDVFDTVFLNVIPEVLTELLHNVTCSKTIEELKDVEEHAMEAYKMISDIANDSEGEVKTAILGYLSALVQLQSFIHYMIVNEIIPNDEIVARFIDNPSEFLMNFNEEDNQ